MRNREQDKAIIAAIKDLVRDNDIPTVFETTDDAFSVTPEVAAFITAARTGWPEDLAWRERAEALLRRIEWIPCGGFSVCPGCLNEPHQGHDPNCELAALLGEESK